MTKRSHLTLVGDAPMASPLPEAFRDLAATIDARRSDQPVQDPKQRLLLAGIDAAYAEGVRAAAASRTPLPPMMTATEIAMLTVWRAEPSLLDRPLKILGALTIRGMEAVAATRDRLER